MVDDEADDQDDVAFPTSEHESRYEMVDEPDDVYADFSVIFGGGQRAMGKDGEDDDDDDEDDRPVGGLAFGDDGGGVAGYEDYMDELDGIPWGAR
jgi:hypothetical protein